MFFPLMGCKRGSTSLRTCFIRFVSKCLMLLCLIITNHPRFQFSVWLTLYCWPQRHWEGSSRSSLAYRSLRASLNSPLSRMKPSSSSSRAESQLDAPFSLASSIALLACSVNFSLMFFNFWSSADPFCLTIYDLVVVIEMRLLGQF